MINLKAFCGTSEPLSTPFLLGDWTYATNGHVAIRVPKVDSIGSHPKAPATIAGMFAEASRWQPFPVVTLPVPLGQRCLDCQGCGWNVECDQCDGTGEHGCEHDHCSCTHDCPDCDGTGRVTGSHDTPEAYRRPCESCEGQGTTLDQRRVVLRPDTMLQLRYLRLVLSLPGPVEFVDRGPLEPQMFRGDGWTALIMPMRYDRNIGDRLVVTEIDLPWRKQEVAA